MHPAPHGLRADEAWLAHPIHPCPFKARYGSIFCVGPPEVPGSSAKVSARASQAHQQVCQEANPYRQGNGRTRPFIRCAPMHGRRIRSTFAAVGFAMPNVPNATVKLVEILFGPPGPQCGPGCVSLT